ncbi:glycosyltransferase family 9 protein [Sporomusa sp. GT1]|uniref:glycosyltransferase family 9 protein n=1 Tax=Sporomusa sp. GT1 TaxID=1534747 RepID=UPI001664C2C0|nr:glycosyltransferase family 9 protein [Sporomusa sp. GT1]
MKKFLVINTSYFGDVLLTDTLCRNIKLEYPDSRIIFMVNKPFYQAAQYLEGVDEVLCYDKKGEHKGIFGILKFLQQYRQNYKDSIDVALVLYGNERGIFIANAFGANTIISNNRGLLHYLFYTQLGEESRQGSVQQNNANLLKTLTKKDVSELPIKYNPPPEAVIYAQQLLQPLLITPGTKVIGLCATSKKVEKDIPVATAVTVIADLNQAGKKVVLMGSGTRAAEYAAELHARGCSTFLDLTDKTSITQLAGVIQQCAAVISVDTGTLHLTCALSVPLVALFYINDAKHLEKWAPAKYYPHVLLTGDIMAEDIVKGLKTLLVK